MRKASRKDFSAAEYAVTLQNNIGSLQTEIRSRSEIPQSLTGFNVFLAASQRSACGHGSQGAPANHRRWSRAAPARNVKEADGCGAMQTKQE